MDGIKIIEEEFTAGAYITTDRADNQITGFNPGAMKYQSSFNFDCIDPGSSLCLIAPGNLRDMAGHASLCRSRGIRYICDPGQSLTGWDGKNLREWIDGSLMFISNDYELELTMKMTGMDKKGLLRLTGTVVTTFGEKGSLVSIAGDEMRIPPAEIHGVVDPTGAGDAFRAGLVKGLILSRDIVTAAKMGSVAAAYAVEKYGTQEHLFSYEDFLERFRSNFGEI